ncbi:DUF551 domain-containing protein [Escherichia coli]|nr:DUF551 domain-containing protein [Escherichia coli]EHY3673446.1 DUF551 domain-containing protein [Escherichia coli]
MTTFTDKELIKEIKERISSLDVRDNIERRAYEIALVSLEAKPIGAFHIAEQQVDGTSDYIKDGEWPIDNGTIEVYAAPPVPVVPEEKPMPNPLSMYAVDVVAAILHGSEPVSQAYKLPPMSSNEVNDAAWKLHNMLTEHGPLNGCQFNNLKECFYEALKVAMRNYPVIPDGWISCSERMPEKNQNVLISVNFDSSLVEPLICSARYTGSTFRRGDATIKPGNGIEQATHWMPLPEPPQEVK